MPESTTLLDGIGQWSYQEAHRQVSLLGGVDLITSTQLLDLLDCVPAIVEGYPDNFTFTLGKDTFTTTRYESLIWTLGESYRRILKRNKSLRRAPNLWIRIEGLCLNQQLGKGRESFTMLLGQYGGEGRIPVLLDLLEDPQVQGHALYALRLLGAREARTKAEQLMNSQKSWVRAEARKYLHKCVR